MAERNENTLQIQRYYVWTPGGQLLYLIDAANGNAVRFFHYDRVGSTLALTSGAGAVTDAYAYSPYGVLLGHMGTSPQPFTYIGAFGVRAEGALYHMRARYYDPASARFLMRDSVPPNLSDVRTLDPYLYAVDNPIRYVDPNGTEFRDLHRYGALNAAAIWMCPSPLTDSPKTATAGGFDPVPPTAAPPASDGDSGATALSAGTPGSYAVIQRGMSDSSVIVGDFNGDGVPDILVPQSLNSVGGNYRGSFAHFSRPPSEGDRYVYGLPVSFTCAPVTQAWFISTTIDLNPPASGGGYGLAGSDGGIFAFGNAHYRGSLPGSATGLGIANRLTDEDTDDANSLSGRFDRRNNGTITDTGHSRARVR
jgi:RHS repeat-associated protein